MVLFVSHKKWSPLNRCVCLSCFILIYSSRVSVCLILCSCTAISAHCNPLVKSAIQHSLKFELNWIEFVYPEVLRAHAQKAPFFLSCFDRFGEKSQKLLLKDNFQIRDFWSVLITVLGCVPFPYRNCIRGGPFNIYNQYLIASNWAPSALSNTQKTFLDGRHKATKLRAQEDLINGLDGSGSWLVAPPPYHAYLVAKPSYCC